MNSEEEKYMLRCIQLARNGQCNAAPNPMVGAVIVCDGKIIGEGYHVRCGEAHAEVNAIRSVKDTSLLRRSTITSAWNRVRTMAKLLLVQTSSSKSRFHASLSGAEILSPRLRAEAYRN